MNRTQQGAAVSAALMLGLTMSPYVSAVSAATAATDHLPATAISAGSMNDALFAIESNRDSIAARIVDRLEPQLKARSIAPITMTSALRGLRADQLLSASLANTLDDVLMITQEPVTDGVATHRYVALSPRAVAGYRVPDGASAFVLRSGVELEVVSSIELKRAPASAAIVVGYFVPGATPVMGSSTGNSAAIDMHKDGTGSGSGSWIGFTAGGNIASGQNSAVTAGFNNKATNLGAFVGAGQNNTAGGVSSLVLGGFGNNAIGLDSLVGAGAFNAASGARSVVVGGYGNSATGNYSFIGAGGRDPGTAAAAGQDVKDNVVSGDFGAIVGGQGNRVSGSSGFIGGGRENIASGNKATISGGAGNRATGQSSTVGGGGYGGTSSVCYDHLLQTGTAACWNEANGQASTVSGGSNNRANGAGGFVGGGEQNAAAGNNSAVVGGNVNSTGANSSNSFVGGGFANAVTGSNAVIVGGSRNSVSGYSSTIVGGSGGINTGYSSFIGNGGSGNASNCYNHQTGASDVNCWNEIGAQGNSATIVGGYNNRTNNFTAFIGGGASNSVTQNEGVIVGGAGNVVSNYSAFIGGGNRNTASGGSASVVGGSQNVASGGSSVVTGGYGNKATANSSAVVAGGFGTLSNCFNFVTSLSDRPCWNESNASASIVGAGYDNVIGATVGIGNSAIVSGAGNRNAGDKSFLGGGTSNTIAQDDGLATPTNVNSAVLVGGRFNSVSGFAAALVGGSDNIASGPRAFVGAGRANTASGDRSAIVGGGSTSLTCFNKATGLQDFSCANVSAGQYAFVGAGVGNRASGNQSVVSGGVDNDATGFRAAVAGGSSNTASGTGSFAAGRGNTASGSWSAAMGRGARTNTGGATPTHHFGTFVWSDTPDDGTPATPIATQPYFSTAANQFAVRARGGVSFKVGAPAIADPTDPGYVSNAADATPGCSLPAGGAASWSCTSDRNTKEAILAISPKAILAKVTALPLSTWQFKGTERRHLSPMAQDFWAAFGLGVNDKSITSSDVSGVALGAIQGLSQELKKKNAEIALLKREMAAIRKKLGM